MRALQLDFLSNKRILKRFTSLLCYYQRFQINSFQQRLILFETPLFHQYLFKIANCWVVRSYKR